MIAHRSDISHYFGVPMGTLRQWAARGYLTRYAQGYDVREVWVLTKTSCPDKRRESIAKIRSGERLDPGCMV